MTLKDAKHAVSNLQTERLETLGDGYHSYWLEDDYAGVPQRRLLVHI